MTFECHEPSELPKGWTRTTFAEIGEVNPPLPFAAVQDDFEVSFLPMKAIEEVTGKFDLSTVRTYGEVKKGYTSFIDGDIIFAKITPCMENGKIAVVDSLLNSIGFGSTEFHVIRLYDRNISKKFFFYFLVQKSFRREAKMHMSGSAGQLRVPSKYMENVCLPLPPYNEQLRIVSKVEELFSFLDAGVESLRKIKAQLKRYRQAVLKYAFEGKLTEEWRKTHKHQTQPTTKLSKRVRQDDEEYVDPSSTNRLALNGLPENWSWEEIGAIADLISGQHIMKEDYNFDQSGLPYLTGPADFGSESPIVSKWTTKPKVVAKDGDVLVTVKGAGVGKVNILEIKEAVISRQLMAIRARHARPKFVFHYIQHTFGNIRKMGSGSTVPGIRREELLGLLLPFPSIAEQDQIVSEIENRMQVVVDVEKTLARSPRQTESLRQSILKNAFEGKLVPQDPNDEPAEKLLARIREDRVKSKGEKDTNKRRKNKPMQLELSTYVK